MFFYIFPLFLFFACNSAFEQGYLEPWHYINAFIIIIIIISRSIIYSRSMFCTLVHGTNRKFNTTWLNDHKWMSYSVSTDSVYCALFSTQRKHAKDKTFVSSPVCDWSKMSKLSQRHVKEGANHYACVTMGENFLKVACGEQLCIADQFNVQHRQLVERNRQILTKIPEVIILCGKQNIPIRGHSEEDSNFTAIFKTPRTIQSPHGASPGACQSVHQVHFTGRSKRTD